MFINKDHSGFTVVLILVLIAFAAHTNAQRQAPSGSLSLILSSAPKTADGKGAILEQETSYTQIVLDNGSGIVDSERILATTFTRRLDTEKLFRLKIENRSDREWSFLVVQLSPDKSCVSILPFKALSQRGLTNNSEVPVQRVLAERSEVSEWLTENVDGESRFAVLASPSAQKLIGLFMSVEFLAGLSTGRSEPAEPDLKDLNLGKVSRNVTITLGSVNSSTGEKLRSADFYDSMLLIARCRFQYDGNRRIEYDKLATGWLNNMGLANYQTGDLAKAIANYEQALELLKPGLDPNPKALMYEEATIRSNLAMVYATLGNPASSRAQYLTAQRLLMRSAHQQAETNLVSVFGGVGLSYETEKNYAEAARYYDKALTLSRDLGMTASEGIILNSLGRLASVRGDLPGAESYFDQAIRLSIQTMNEAGIASASNNLGWLLTQQRKYTQAQSAFTRSYIVFKRLGNRTALATALSNLMFVEQRLGLTPLAIVHGKEAVNLLQSVRSDISGVERQLQRSFLLSRTDTYRNLSDLLVSIGRLPEAQSVLEMLKQEEVFDYIKRDASDAANLGQRADLRPEESAALKRYTEIAEKIGTLGAEFEKLSEAKNKLPENTSLPEPDQKRLDEVARQLEDANTVFQLFLRQLSDEFSKRSNVVSDIQENAGLQADLRSWGDGVVSLYTVVGQDRYRVILTTPNVQVDGKTEVKVAYLNKKIAEFRTAIQDPKIDPRPIGKELYDIIVRPIEKHLEGSRAKTLLWSLDGTLRYIPIAALWDGKQFFGQKYQNVVITLASRTRLSDEPSADWRVLGLGVTAAKTLVEPNGTRTISFSPLPAVREELTSIIKDENNANEIGVLSGKRLLDESFTEQALKDRLGKGFKAVHIASHFSFRPGDMTKSFLLLGDGSALTMDNFRRSPQLRFTGVELLTLSACQTAVGETDANGNEIESFAVIAQQNGAKAVMATLWPVADESTSLFMREFYRVKKEEPLSSKAAAIQIAQKAMIEGKLRSSGTGGGCRAELNPGTGQKPFKCDPKAPFSHPYFWSPFILIGNWK